MSEKIRIEADRIYGLVTGLAGKRDATAADVVEEKGLRQMNDTGALEQVVSDILAANPKVVEDYRGGKTNALGFLVGQCMRASKGKGNPNILREMLEKALNS